MSFVKRNTASFDVDAQKGFTPLCPDELPVAGGEALAEALNRQAALPDFVSVRKMLTQ